MQTIYHNKRNAYLRKMGFAGILFLLLLQNGCSGQVSTEPLSVTDYKLNTIVSLQVYDAVDEALLTEALSLCDKYELIFSKTNPDSELYRLNEAASAEALQHYLLSDELRELLDIGLQYSSLSHGAFDITIEPVSSLWDFQAENPSVPQGDLIASRLPLVGCDNVMLTGNVISMSLPGMGLDAGALAKGYIADRIRDYLVENGVEHAIINLGGNVLCIGARPDGAPYRIGVRTPFADPNDTSMLLQITDQSVVTTGIYERCFEQDNVLYHHIIDTHTGYPYDNGIASVTIITKDSTDADILSTTCFALGIDDGLALIESLTDTEAAYLMIDGSIQYSSGFEAYLATN